MASDDPAGALELPQLDQDGVDEARSRVSQHVSAAKRGSKGVGLGRRRRVLKDGMEVRDGTGRKEKPPDSSDEEEVGDDWFRLPDTNNERIGLSIGKIPRRAGMRIRKTIRRVKEGRFSSDLVFEEDEDEPDVIALKALEEKKEDEHDAGGAVLSAVPSVSGATAFYASPQGSTDSLVSLDLPLPSRSQISFSRLSQTSSRPGFAPLAQLPTLTELQSRDSAASSSPPESTYSPPLEAPTRTLTIDDCIDSLSRRDSRLGGMFLRQRHRHLPGRKHLHGQKRRTTKLDTHIGESAELDMNIAKALKEAGVIKDEEDKVECDVLWEHQRGMVVFGLPKFTANLLFQVDPPEWCDASLKPCPFSPHTFPCPPYWVWRDSEFMIDMSGDKDEEGWSYAVRFRSKYWRGEAIFGRAFVRRRRWIRTRVYRPKPVLPLTKPEEVVGLPDTAEDEFLGPHSCPDTDSLDAIHDLRTACAALPLSPKRRAALFAESVSPASFAVGEVDPRNPFLAFKRIKMEATATFDGGECGTEKASSKEPVWRDAVREINYRRVLGVLKAHARIDRQRLELWRLWLGARDLKGVVSMGVRADAAEGPAKGVGQEGAKAVLAAAKVVAKKERTDVWEEIDGDANRPEADDVWDVIESKLDPILALFDYNISRLKFLSTILAVHPIRHDYHRYKGYDLPLATQRHHLERALEARLAFYGAAKDLARKYGGWVAEAQKAGASLEDVEEEREEEERRVMNGNGHGARASSRDRKGKRRAEFTYLSRIDDVA
ncbi:hypothetical protein NBRC10513v2_001267 [Rhodotorula toruloides]|nr:hypothetical protein AAT19DRAFT_16159 [Rhodotorula toruloides]